MGRQQGRHPRSRLAAVAVLAVLAAGAGALALSPAIGGPGQPLTKTQAKDRFLGSGSKVTLSAGPSGWVEDAGDLSDGTVLAPADGVTRLTDTAPSNNQDIYLALPAPLLLAGERAELVKVALCYETDADNRLDRVAVRLQRGKSADPVGSAKVIVSDETNRDDDRCRTYRPAEPKRLASSGDSPYLVVQADIVTGGTEIRLGAVTVTYKLLG